MTGNLSHILSVSIYTCSSSWLIYTNLTINSEDQKTATQNCNIGVHILLQLAIQYIQFTLPIVSGSHLQYIYTVSLWHRMAKSCILLETVSQHTHMIYYSLIASRMIKARHPLCNFQPYTRTQESTSHYGLLTYPLNLQRVSYATGIVQHKLPGGYSWLKDEEIFQLGHFPIKLGGIGIRLGYTCTCT